MRKLITLVLLFQSSLSSFATIVKDTLYINRDTVNQATTLIHYCSFNSTETFELTNKPLEVNENDTLQVTIINTDSLTHTFTIDNVLETGNNIAPSDSATFQLEFNTKGTYRYYSDVAYGKYLAASGNILVGYSNYIHFFWNLFEAKDTFMDSIANGLTATLPNYFKPEVFTINNLYFPYTATDTLGAVTGNVNDSIIISVVNSGQMVSPFHFHGYHVKIIDVKIHQTMLGWEKDTFPVFPGEAMTLLLVPDQPGMYPVHNHNLVTVATGGYPGGMITRLNIMP